MKQPDFNMSYWCIPGVRKPDMPTIYRKTDESIAVGTIIDMVCLYFDVTIEQLKSKNRARQICYPRHIAMFLLYNYCIKSCQSVANYFNRDHTSVLHAVRSIKNLVDTEPAVRHEIDMFLLKIL